MTILGQRIRLDPNDVQATFFERCAGTARFAFNWGLARWQERHEAGGRPSWRSLNAELNAIKADELPWMAELPWAVTNRALADLGAAFAHFFRRVRLGQKPGLTFLDLKGIIAVWQNGLKMLLSATASISGSDDLTRSFENATVNIFVS